MTDQELCYVRYLGTKVCWTDSDGRFYIGDRDELNEMERKVCDNGGGYVPLTFAVKLVLKA